MGKNKKGIDKLSILCYNKVSNEGGEIMEYKFDHRPTASEIKKPLNIIYLIMPIIAKSGMTMDRMKFLKTTFLSAITMVIIILSLLERRR